MSEYGRSLLSVKNDDDATIIVNIKRLLRDPDYMLVLWNDKNDDANIMIDMNDYKQILLQEIEERQERAQEREEDEEDEEEQEQDDDE